jgi:hypothetical protein
MNEEKKGRKKDLMGHSALAWTLKDQLDAQNKKRKTALSKMESKKTTFFKSGDPRTANTHTNLLQSGDLKKLNSDYEDVNASRMMKVNKAGIT